MDENQAKQAILFDIDHTLLDTDQLIKEGQDDFAQFIKPYTQHKPTQVAADYIKILRQLAKDVEFNLSIGLKTISQQYNLPFEELLPPYQKLIINMPYQNYFYPNVLKSLKKLRIDYCLGIYSEGDVWYQKLKVKPIKKYLDQELIFIWPNKLEHTAKLPERVTIIDDSTRVIKSLKQDPVIKKKKIKPILFEREEFIKDSQYLEQLPILL